MDLGAWYSKLGGIMSVSLFVIDKYQCNGRINPTAMAGYWSSDHLCMTYSTNRIGICTKRFVQDKWGQQIRENPNKNKAYRLP
jgi:hypothetical protein